jgi:hypothetical protein
MALRLSGAPARTSISGVMKTHRMFNLLWLALIGAVLSLASLARASSDVPPELADARTDLEKAWNPAGDPPSPADRTKLLNAALDLLKKAPSGSGTYWRHIQAARKFINSALYELQKGDPDQKATDLIHSAVSEVRDIT